MREGRPELAIAEYLRLVEDQPGDVGAANALGDLYVKVGNRALAVAQFVQIGDSHRDSGFVPKAVAFYKKALKIDPASDHALSQLAQIAIEQKLYADATLYLNRLLQRRREQSNEAGVAECLVRLGGFPAATADAKMAAARAAAGHFPATEASRLWVDAADALERAGRPREALDVLMQAASLDTEDVALKRRIAIACADSGQIDRARAFLSLETAGDRGDLLSALAEQARAEGRDDDARRALQRVIEVAPERRAEAEALLAPQLPPAPSAEPEPEPAGDGRWDPVFDASGAELDASVLLTSDLDVSVQRVAAVAEPPAVTITSTELEWSELLGAEAGAGDGADVGVNDDTGFVVDDDPVEAVAEVSEPAPDGAPESRPLPPHPTAADVSTIAALTAAAENPALQFQAAAQLGRVLLRLDRGREAVTWLERATQAATAVREQRLDVMYELADALEQIGDRGRALDAFADLDFDAASYRDVPERMARLRRVLEEGRAR